MSVYVLLCVCVREKQNRGDYIYFPSLRTHHIHVSFFTHTCDRDLSNPIKVGRMTPAGQFGDTTHTKVFVGGLAWETQKETMKKYFEQFGDILEAVVITDKTTGRSKGYGFVTFREADAAMRACVEATPIIDGRRANCNLASLGFTRSKPSTPKHANGGGGGGRNPNTRVVGGGGFQAGAAAFAFPHYPIQQGIPYNLYGYSPYSAEYAYPTSYYGVYGGGNTQYPLYGSAGNNGLAAATGYYNPYLNYNDHHAGGPLSSYSPGQAAYGVHYPPHHLFQYSPVNSTGIYPPHYGTTVSLAPPAPLQSGVTMTTMQAPIPNR